MHTTSLSNFLWKVDKYAFDFDSKNSLSFIPSGQWSFFETVHLKNCKGLPRKHSLNYIYRRQWSLFETIYLEDCKHLPCIVIMSSLVIAANCT